MGRARRNRPADCPYVGKGGLKLEFALRHFELAVMGLTAADLGCNVGGFTDCLLQHDAAKVYAVDTAYGLLAWTCRTNPRVVVCERSNALEWTPPELLDFVVSDLGWTRQERALPCIAAMLKPGAQALSLVKPQYEADKALLVNGVLPEEHLDPVLAGVIAHCPPTLQVLGHVKSPYVGSGGNVEFWLLVVKKREIESISRGQP